MLLLLLSFSINIILTSAITSSHKTFQKYNSRLYADLFTDYRREMSPYNGHGISNDSYPSEPVTISLQYARLIRVLEPELQHQNLVGIVLDWRDPRLGWNPADYGGIDHIYTNRFTVWIPEFYPCESSQGVMVAPEFSLSIRLNYTGHLNTFIVFSAFYSCEFDVRRFPFDRQSCFYCFIYIHYDKTDELTFEMRKNEGAYIYDTSEWALGVNDSASIYSPSRDFGFNMGLLYYNITLTRRPQFWIGLVITPTFVIGSLIIIGLFFGQATDVINNGIGLGLTTMMSMMVIVGILADAIAKSQYIPILGWYIIAEIVIITLAVFALLSEKAIYKLISSIINATCRESKLGSSPNSKRRIVKEWLIEKGKYSNILLFFVFFLAHAINIIVLFTA
ncbi:hypothetical protein PENTCL1PPCAC_9904 [Pristionchus entomophagus]|uniref:Neurotransmitter-gated ion-channel ligand-binding domain-containing protein n=1 Tax=Pristionchus entomophagus TaxID=358040 RepID=A0AAV5T5C6_9BILA|nr:hypothetical protein PENTCL1PPCAC_9904 [Pristionchus entomophagus]